MRESGYYWTRYSESSAWEPRYYDAVFERWKEPDSTQLYDRDSAFYDIDETRIKNPDENDMHV